MLKRFLVASVSWLAVKKSLIVSIVLLSAMQSNVRSEIIFSDDFSTAGPLIGSSPDIGGIWTQTGTGVVTNPLTVNASNQLVVGNTGTDAFAALSRSVPKTDGDSLVANFSLNVATVLGAGDYFFHFMDPAVNTTTTFTNRIFARPGTGAGLFQVGVLGLSTGTATFGADLNIGQTYSIRSQWNFVPGALNDTFSIGVDSTPYLTNVIWGGTGAEPTNISAVNFRQGAVATGPTVTIDNLTVDSISAVPEPTSVALMSMVGVAGLAARYRRKTGSSSVAV